MGVPERRPVARRWEMSGDVLRCLDRAQGFCAMALPALERCPGYLGKIVLANVELGVMYGMSFWDDTADEERSWRRGTEASAVTALGPEVAATMVRHTYDTVASHFRWNPGGVTAVHDLTEVVARSVTMEGGQVATPSVLSVIRRHMATVFDLPGCLGTLCLADTERSVVVIKTFWSDAATAMRTTALAQESIQSLNASAESTSTRVGTYRSLVFSPIRRIID